MINITVGQNAMKRTISVDESTTTIREALDTCGMDASRTTFHLNADVVTGDMLDKTFAQCDVYENCFLTAVVKADSAR